MSVRRWLTDDLIVRKLKTVSGYRKKMQSTATVEGHVQPIDWERIAYLDGIAGATHIGVLSLDINFTPETGDQIQNKTDSRIYHVLAVEEMTYGTNQHWELILERFNPEDRE